MNKFLAGIVGALMLTISACTQDHTLKSERLKPLTATLVGVCENRQEMLMVVVLTFTNGKTLIVDGKNMQGFENVDALVRYASTAITINQYAQTCGDAAT